MIILLDIFYLTQLSAVLILYYFFLLLFASVRDNNVNSTCVDTFK